MRIGVPKEIKKQEFRVALTPDSVKKLVSDGHQVAIQTMAGEAIGFPDADYKKAGAKILPTAEAVFSQADLIVKVKEPQAVECQMLRPGQALFTYLHLAADKKQAKALLKSKCTAIAYETVTDENGRTPLLAPMSRIAGRLGVLIGSNLLQSHLGGSGVLVSGVQEVDPAHIVILGAGQAGTSSLKMAVGLGARVSILDISAPRLQELQTEYGSTIATFLSSHKKITELLPTADIVIGATYVPGAAAEKLITRGMLKTMRKGSVLVDISIDQGGCFETSKATTHDKPTYVVDGILHYCVANMPGAVARTSAIALNAHTLPYVRALANKGIIQALQADKALAGGLNIIDGKLVNEPVAHALGLKYVSLATVLNSAKAA